MLVLADAHVHIYDCFQLTAFFDAAHEHFRSEAARQGRAHDFVGLLLLSESRDHHWFRRLAEDGSRPQRAPAVPGWAFRGTEESLSLAARAMDGRSLVLIAGHQIVTAEKLEVLALATEERPPEGLSLAESVRCTKDLGGIPVVPWGAGKWLATRGAILERFLEGQPDPGLFLGDNASRLRLWFRPRQFRLADRLGVRILPGSDPLPFKSQGGRAGSFGFSAVAPLSMTHPGRDLKRILDDPGFRPRPYGSLAGPLRFVLSQAAMQIRRHRSLR